MRQLMVLLFVVVAVLTGCTTAGDRARMRAALDSINGRNRSGQPFTVNEVQPYVVLTRGQSPCARTMVRGYANSLD